MKTLKEILKGIAVIVFGFVLLVSLAIFALWLYDTDPALKDTIILAICALCVVAIIAIILSGGRKK